MCVDVHLHAHCVRMHCVHMCECTPCILVDVYMHVCECVNVHVCVNMCACVNVHMYVHIV